MWDALLFSTLDRAPIPLYKKKNDHSVYYDEDIRTEQLDDEQEYLYNALAMLLGRFSIIGACVSEYIHNAFKSFDDILDMSAHQLGIESLSEESKRNIREFFILEFLEVYRLNFIKLVKKDIGYKPTDIEASVIENCMEVYAMEIYDQILKDIILDVAPHIVDVLVYTVNKTNATFELPKIDEMMELNRFKEVYMMLVHRCRAVLLEVDI